MRSRLIGVAVAVLLTGTGITAVRLIHRTEVLGIARVEARSDDVKLMIVVTHNDCKNDPSARLVGETSEVVTIRAERQRDLLGDACDDVGAQTPFEFALAQPLGERMIIVEAPYGPGDCVVDGTASERCVAAGK